MIELYGLISLFTNALIGIVILIIVFAVAMCIDKPQLPKHHSGEGAPGKPYETKEEHEAGGRFWSRL